MSLDNKARQIIDTARQAYLRDVLGWDEAKVQAFAGEPALWVMDAVKAALSEKEPRS